MNDYKNRLKTIENESAKDWFKMKKTTESARIDIYDEIGMWGVTAGDFVSMLNDLDVKTIELHLNSPGGDVYDGIAIYNALKDHDATVNVTVDGLAASAASFIAMAGDNIVMNRNSEMMLHDGWALCIGNSQDMQDMATRLDKISTNIASIYAAKAGGTTAGWRAVMQDEAWYSPDEALKAGLATAVVEDDKEPSAEPKSRFDLSVFNFAGRDSAPAPALDTKNHKTRATVSNSSKQGQENHRVDEEQLKTIGLTAEATPDEISARLVELVLNEVEKTTETKTETKTEEVTEPEPEGDTGGEQNPGKPDTVVAPAPAAPTAPETVVVDKAQHDALTSQLATTTAAVQAMQKKENDAQRDAYLQNAMKDGKFAPAQLAGYKSFWNADPKGAKAMIDGLAKNTVPVVEIGLGEEIDQPQDSDAYPTTFLTAGERAEIQAAYAGQGA